MMPVVAVRLMCKGIGVEREWMCFNLFVVHAASAFLGLVRIFRDICADTCAVYYLRTNQLYDLFSYGQ